MLLSTYKNHEDAPQISITRAEWDSLDSPAPDPGDIQASRGRSARNGFMSRVRHELGDVLQVAPQIWRDGCLDEV